MSDNPLNKHVHGHCPAWPTKDRLTESTRTELEEDLDAFGGRGFSDVLRWVAGSIHRVTHRICGRFPANPETV